MKSKNLSKKLNEQKSALYIRVSTQYQIDKDSLPLQREDLINYSKYALGIEKYEVFEDAGYSAKNTDRPAFQQMMARLRTGEFTHLVVWKIDRISRNLIDFAEMYSEIKKLGITFVSKNEQFDTSNAMGEAMLKIILVFAELERNMTSERVSAVMLSRASNGQWNGGRIPYGYSYDKETQEFSIIEEEAKIIQFIYDSYEAEKSLLAVTKRLNDKGILHRSGHQWTPTTIILFSEVLFTLVNTDTITMKSQKALATQVRLSLKTKLNGLSLKIITLRLSKKNNRTELLNFLLITDEAIRMFSNHTKEKTPISLLVYFTVVLVVTLCRVHLTEHVLMGTDHLFMLVLFEEEQKLVKTSTSQTYLLDHLYSITSLMS